MLFAQALSELIASIDNIRCLGILTKGENATAEIVKFKPDLILLDLNLPDTNGIEVLRQIRKSGIQTPVLIISMLIDPLVVVKAMESGANGFVPKNTSVEELSAALECLKKGILFIPDSMKEDVLFGLNAPTQYAVSNDLPELSKRELEIIKLIAIGLTNTAIAQQLFISPLTVKTHRNNILRKLELPNTAALVSYAKNLGLI